MGIKDLKEVEEYMEANKDKDDVKDYLNGFSKVTSEKASDFLSTDQGRELLQPILDKHVTKSIDTFKEKSLPKILKEEEEKLRAELNPKETDDQKRMRVLESNYAKLEKEKIKSDLKSDAILLATEKGLPVDLVKYFVGDDKETTTDNLSVLERVWKEGLLETTEQQVDGKFKEAARKPVKGATENPPNSAEKKYNEAQRKAVENPKSAPAQSALVQATLDLQDYRNRNKT